jgi:DNA-binding transcriptional LysR family regulator
MVYETVEAPVLDLRRLRLLRELRRRGTIAAVAEALSYSPSAVSQQLATLERETGVSLLEPAGRRVRLTAQAELLVEHAERLLEEMERAEAALARSLQDTVGTLRVAAFQTAVLSLLPTTLLRLGSEHPGLRVEVAALEPETALPGLVSGEHDLVLGEEYPGQPLHRPRELERHDLFRDELRLATPDAWGQRSLGDLAERPFVLEPPGTTAYAWATAVCRTAGFEPDVRYSSSDLQVHHALVAHGLAAALVPALSVLVEHDAEHLARLAGRPRRRVFAAVRRGAAGHPTVRAFIDILTDEQRTVTQQLS